MSFKIVAFIGGCDFRGPGSLTLSEIPRLNDNFDQWKLEFVCFLRHKDLWKFTHSERPENLSNSDWLTGDAYTRNIIEYSLKTDSAIVSECEAAFKAWIQVEKFYGKHRPNRLQN